MTTEERLTRLESQNRKLKRLLTVLMLAFVGAVVVVIAPEKPLAVATASPEKLVKLVADDIIVVDKDGKTVIKASNDGNLTAQNDVEVGHTLKVNGVDVGEAVKNIRGVPAELAGLPAEVAAMKKDMLRLVSEAVAEPSKIQPDHKGAIVEWAHISEHDTVALRVPSGKACWANFTNQKGLMIALIAGMNGWTVDFATSGEKDGFFRDVQITGVNKTRVGK